MSLLILVKTTGLDWTLYDGSNNGSVYSVLFNTFMWQDFTFDPENPDRVLWYHPSSAAGHKRIFEMDIADTAISEAGNFISPIDEFERGALTFLADDTYAHAVENQIVLAKYTTGGGFDSVTSQTQYSGDFNADPFEIRRFGDGRFHFTFEEALNNKQKVFLYNTSPMAFSTIGTTQNIVDGTYNESIVTFDDGIGVAYNSNPSNGGAIKYFYSSPTSTTFSGTSSTGATLTSPFQPSMTPVVEDQSRFIFIGSTGRAYAFEDTTPTSTVVQFGPTNSLYGGGNPARIVHLSGNEYMHVSLSTTSTIHANIFSWDNAAGAITYHGNNVEIPVSGAITSLQAEKMDDRRVLVGYSSQGGGGNQWVGLVVLKL